MSTTETIDWDAAKAVTRRLGAHTRRLVAERDIEQAREWARMLSLQNIGVRSISYYELAVILGHRSPMIDDASRRDWRELVQATEDLAAAVRAKTADEDARVRAEVEANARAEAAQAEADKTAAGNGTEKSDVSA